MQFGVSGGWELGAQSCQRGLARVIEQHGTLQEPLLDGHAMGSPSSVSLDGVGHGLKLMIHRLYRNVFLSG